MIADAALEALLRERLALVAQARLWKPDRAAVQAPERVLAVVVNVRAAAAAAGLSAADVEERYRRVVAWCIDWEARGHEALGPHPGEAPGPGARESAVPAPLPLDELRARIDALDRAIVARLAEPPGGASTLGASEEDALVARLVAILRG